MKPLIIVKEVRDPKEWRTQVKPFELPSRWPKGQTVMDRLYWCDAAGQLATPFTKESDRINGLHNRAMGLL